jgi:hypothetical protein
VATVIHLPVARPAEPTVPSLVGNASSSWDVSLNGMGFLLKVTADDPVLRETAPFKKDQFDAASSPGEQTLSNWWLRHQASFHGGAGLKYLDVVKNEVNEIRYDQSYNLDVWTPGQVTRLPDTTQVITSASTPGGLVTGRVSTTNYALAAFGSGLQKYSVTDAGVTATSTYTWGGSNQIQSMTSDGTNYYAAETGGIYKGPINGGSSGTKIWNGGTLLTIGWVKQRLVAGIDKSLYELVGAGPTLPTALYDHPNTAWRWSAFAEGPRGILAAGYAGDESTIYALDLSTQGVAPTLTSGVVAAPLPTGERVYTMFSYANRFLVLGTNKGLRVGTFDDQGNLTLGPLTIETTSEITCINARGNFLYVGTKAFVEGESCLTRVDLGTVVDDAGRFAYAPDLVGPSLMTGAVSFVAPLASRMAFVITGQGLMLEGNSPGTARDAWLRTSRIRFQTVEPKLFKFCKVRGDFPSTLTVYATTPSTGEVQVIQLTSSLSDPDEFELPAGGHEWVALRFSIRGASAQIRSYGIKALPASRRQRLIQLPLQCWDMGQDRNGRAVGYRGYALARLQALEALEQEGDVITFESLTPWGQEAHRCQIDRVQFRQESAPTKTSGLGGLLTVTLRTVD